MPLRPKINRFSPYRRRLADFSRRVLAGLPPRRACRCGARDYERWCQAGRGCPASGSLPPAGRGSGSQVWGCPDGASRCPGPMDPQLSLPRAGPGLCLPVCQTACPIATIRNTPLWPALDSCMRLPTGLTRPRPLSRIRCQGAGASDVILACTCVSRSTGHRREGLAEPQR